MARIFISYRRADSSGYAGRLYDRLTGHFGKASIFMDIDAIPPGVDFVEYLANAIQSYEVVLVLIGDRWLSVTDAQGNRRLDDSHDFVRIEIASALKYNKLVIPVLVKGAQMPRATDLPSDLQPLTRRNALDLSDKNFHHDVDDLIQGIEWALGVSDSAPYNPTVSSSQLNKPQPQAATAPPVSKPAPVQPASAGGNAHNQSRTTTTPQRTKPPRKKSSGSVGIVEYALILVLTAVVTIIVLTLLGPEIGTLLGGT